jgi:hypothetical protein
MTAPTRKLHEHLIRLAKSVIAVWETWLKEQNNPVA